MKELNYDENLVSRFTNLYMSEVITKDELYSFQFRGLITMQEYLKIVKNTEDVLQ